MIGFPVVVVSGFLALIDLFIWSHKRYEEEDARKERERQEVEGGRICRVCARAVGDSGDGGGEQPGQEFLVNTAARGPTTGNAVTTGNDGGDDDKKPHWPLKWIMIVDFLLTGALFWVLLAMIFSDTHSTSFWDYNYFGERFLYYASVPVGYSMVLHARCWWRQLKARQRDAWLKEIEGTSRERGTTACDVERGTIGSVGGCCIHGDLTSCQLNASNACAGSGAVTASSSTGLKSAVKSKAQELNDGLKAVLLPKGQSAVAEERRPLLWNETSHIDHLEEGQQNDRCTCQAESYWRSSRPKSDRTSIHSWACPVLKKEGRKQDSNAIRGRKPPSAHRQGASLTPSGADTTNDASSTASSTEVHDSTEGDNKVVDRDTYDRGVVDNTSSSLIHDLPATSRDDDAYGVEVMVVKKSKKRKHKGLKGKGRDEADEI